MSLDNIRISKAEPQSMENRSFVKKNQDIPNLCLGKVLKSDRDQPKTAGWQSDRGSQKHLSQEDSSPRYRLTESRQTAKEAGGKGNVNFYLYKNFNKFIQNLYVKSGEPVKLKPKLQKSEKGINNPASVQEISSSNLRKTTFNRTAGQFRSPKADISGRLTNQTEPDEIYNYRKHSPASAQKFSSLSPRGDRDEVLEIEDLKKKKGMLTDRVSTKSNKAAPPKAFQHLDFNKVSSSKGVIKYM